MIATTGNMMPMIAQFDSTRLRTFHVQQAVEPLNHCVLYHGHSADLPTSEPSPPKQSGHVMGSPRDRLCVMVEMHVCCNVAGQLPVVAQPRQLRFPFRMVDVAT